MEIELSAVIILRDYSMNLTKNFANKRNREFVALMEKSENSVDMFRRKRNNAKLQISLKLMFFFQAKGREIQKVTELLTHPRKHISKHINLLDL